MIFLNKKLFGLISISLMTMTNQPLNAKKNKNAPKKSDNFISKFSVDNNFLQILQAEAQAADNEIIGHNKERPKNLPAHKFATYRQPCRCTSDCMPDISFGIADIKFDTKSLKILELGEGTRSMFLGYDSLNRTGAMWSKIWDFLHLASKNIVEKKQLFLVDYELTTPANRRAVGYNRLIKHGGIGVTSLDEMIEHPTFQQCVKGKRTILAIIRHFPANHVVLQELTDQYPNLLICDAAIAPFVNDKKSTDELFTDALRVFRPWSTTLKKNELLNEVEHILATCPAKTFVIKPTDSCKGNGILFAKRNHLEETLFKLINPNQRTPHTRSHNEAFWDNHLNRDVIIESCEKSKPTITEKGAFDGTLRVVYGLMHHEEIITTALLGAYWKLPAKPIDAQASLEQKKLSRVLETAANAAPVAEEDLQIISSTLLPTLASLYVKMLQTTSVKN